MSDGDKFINLNQIDSLTKSLNSKFANKIDLDNIQTKVDELSTVKDKFFKDENEYIEGYEGVDIFSIEGATVSLDGTPATYYRIPALTVSANNTIIAFTDVRYDTAADNSGKISIYCRRSIDKGKTWGEPIEVAKYPVNEDGTAISNVSRTMDSTVLSTKSGKIFCLNGAWEANTWNPSVDQIVNQIYTEDSFVGRWIHIVMTKSSDNGATIYQDGEPVFTDSGVASVSVYDRICFGNNMALVKKFVGKLANMKIYDKVLTEEEILELYKRSNVN